MRVAAIAFASVLAFSGTAALAHSHKYKHHSMHHSMNKMQGSETGGSPNGTAGGPTTTSGTGSSKFGGSTPGTSGKQ
jgi:hypothetical protein